MSVLCVASLLANSVGSCVFLLKSKVWSSVSRVSMPCCCFTVAEFVLNEVFLVTVSSVV